MTAREVIDALWRRWYVLAAGLVLLSAVLLLQWRATGVYWTRFDVQLAPPTRLNPNSLAYANDTLADTAAVITMRYNRHTMSPGPSSPGVTIVDQGVRQGASVRVTDFGRQWSRDFRPAVDVQVADASPEAVTRQADAITRRLGTILDQAQAQLGAPEKVRIIATRIPDDPPIYYQAGSRMRAVGATMMVGGSALATVTVLFDGWALRRRTRRPAATRQPALVG